MQYIVNTCVTIGNVPKTRAFNIKNDTALTDDELKTSIKTTLRIQTTDQLSNEKFKTKTIASNFTIVNYEFDLQITDKKSEYLKQKNAAIEKSKASKVAQEKAQKLAASTKK